MFILASWNGRYWKDTVVFAVCRTGSKRKSVSVSFLLVCLIFINAFSFSRVFFIDAATKQSLIFSFKAIFQNTPALKAFGRVNSPQTVLDWIAQLEDEWLIVYDNAEDFISGYLPSGSKENILITSRNPGLARHTSGLRMALDQMFEDDAITLFKSSGCHNNLSTEDENFCKEIVSAIELFPLAVDLAGAYTAADNGFCDLHEYLKLFAKGKAEMLNTSNIVNATPYHNTIYGAWEMSIRAIEANAVDSKTDHEASIIALTLLQLFAFFHHSNIDEDIFKRAAISYAANNYPDDFLKPPALSLNIQNILKLDQDGESWNMSLFRKGINILCSSSLIKKSKNNRIYSIHPLIHSWSKDRIPSSTQPSICYEAYTILLSSVTLKHTDYAIIPPLLPHIKANQQFQSTITNNQEIYNDYLYERLQFVYRNNNDKKEKQLLLKMIELREEKLNAQHSKTLEIKMQLGTFYLENHNIKEAENILSPIVILMKEVNGENHPMTLVSMRNLADVYCAQDKLTDAEALYNTVLQAQKIILGPNDADTIFTMNRLPDLYENQGQLEKAEVMYKELISLNNIILGDGHIGSLDNMANLASLYFHQKQYQEAEKLLLETVNKQKAIRGDEHQNTLKYEMALGYIYFSQDKFAEAETVFVDILPKIMKTENQAMLLTTKIILASVFIEQENWEKAEHSIMPLVDIVKNNPEIEDCITILSLMDDLALEYFLCDKLIGAEKTSIEVISIKEKLLGEEHEETLKSKNGLSMAYRAQAKFQEAENILLSEVRSRERIYGIEHPETLSSMHDLAMVYTSQNNYAQAEKIFYEVISTRDKILGEEHEETLSSKSNLALIYRKQG